MLIVFPLLISTPPHPALRKLKKMKVTSFKIFLVSSSHLKRIQKKKKQSVGSERRLKPLLKGRSESHLWISVFCTLLPSLINNSSGRTGVWTGPTTGDAVMEDTATAAWEPGQGVGQKGIFWLFSSIVLRTKLTTVHKCLGAKGKEAHWGSPCGSSSRAQSDTEKARENVGGQRVTSSGLYLIVPPRLIFPSPPKLFRLQNFFKLKLCH